MVAVLDSRVVKQLNKQRKHIVDYEVPAYYTKPHDGSLQHVKYRYLLLLDSLVVLGYQRLLVDLGSDVPERVLVDSAQAEREPSEDLELKGRA